MDTITPTFQANDKSELRSMKGTRLGKFRVDVQARTLFYTPGRLLFAIEFDQARPRPTQLRARVVHSRSGSSPLRVATLRTLALEAIHAFLFAWDRWEPEPYM